jgi:hypothetical protein
LRYRGQRQAALPIFQGMAQRSRSRSSRRRNRRLSRFFLYLAYAGTAIVALAQVIAALGQIVGFLHRVLGALGDGAAAGLVAGMDAPSRAAMIRPATRGANSLHQPRLKKRPLGSYTHVRN